MGSVAQHLVKWMKSPDLLLVQEAQDQNGATDTLINGVVTSDGTLAALRNSIASAGGANYTWAIVDPVSNQDVGELGGNVRVAFLYRPEVLKLVSPNHGSSTVGTTVKVINGKVELSLNPGRIDPTNPVFNASRNSVATGEHILAINVHQSGSSSIHGDARPGRPLINGAVDGRVGQSIAPANFIASVLATDPAARIVIGGDFNDFTFTKAAFAPYFANGMVGDADIVVNIPPVERYTYAFDMNAQQLDHILVSKEVAKTLEYEHIHLNTWASESSYESE